METRSLGRSFGLVLSILSIMMILIGLLMIVSKNRPYYIPEGFANQYPDNSLSEIQNPLLKIIKKLGSMTTYFANPSVWVDVYKTSQMSITELARQNIKKEKELAGTKKTQ
jgi:hypothetical protein